MDPSPLPSAKLGSECTSSAKLGSECTSPTCLHGKSTLTPVLIERRPLWVESGPSELP